MNTGQPHLRALLLAALCLLVSSAGLADTKGKLTGRIIDPQGQPVIGANVVIVGAQTGAAADPEGRYTILNIPAGVYDVRISAVGYQTALVRQVHINAGQTTTLNQTIAEAAIETGEVVSVAERPLVDTRQTSSVSILSRDEIEELPVQSLNDVVEPAGRRRGRPLSRRPLRTKCSTRWTACRSTTPTTTVGDPARPLRSAGGAGHQRYLRC